jgi:hypothetical protein
MPKTGKKRKMWLWAMIIDRQSVPWNSWIRRPVEATKDTPRMR